MTQLNIFDHTPGSKEKGGCSEEAALILAKTGRGADLRRACLNKIGNSQLGLTANECAVALKEEITSIRPRVSDLHNLGLIEKDGTRKIKGRFMAVWRLTSLGHTYHKVGVQ